MTKSASIHAKAIELGKHVLRMTTASGSGHPTTAIALAHIVVELMYRCMRYDPADPWNTGNDRLVLSVGHAVPIVYAAYADLRGVIGKQPSQARGLTFEDLASLRELSSELDGHPNPAEGFPFFDAATGSLGQGLSVGAGLGLAARLNGSAKRIYVILGDGEAREGQVWEAMDFIVDHGLTNVCAIFSCNGEGQADKVSPQQSAGTIVAKARAFGWNVVEVDGHDPTQLAEAFDKFQATLEYSSSLEPRASARMDTPDDRIANQSVEQNTGKNRSLTKPVAIVAKTVKGWGIDFVQGKNYHGKPLSSSELEAGCTSLDATGKRLGVDGAGLDGDLSAELQKPAATIENSNQPLPQLPRFADAMKQCGLAKALDEKKLATRQAYGVALKTLGDIDERIVCLDADVSNSTFSDIFARAHADRFFECKIAEQNMISVGAGLAAAGKIPFASSFGKFLARACDQIDMAGITRANLKLCGSHTGVSLAADGPSQMALSDVAYFRSMTRVDSGNGTPVCRLFQPSDAISAYRCCELMARTEGLCYMRTHRPAAGFLYPVDETFELSGCKQIRQGNAITLAGSGFMVHTALRAAEALAKQGKQVNVFDAYVFPLDHSALIETAKHSGGTILVVEDNYIGGLFSDLAEAASNDPEVRVVGMTVKRIPKSAKTPDEVFDYVGIGVNDIVEKAMSLI